MNLPCMLDFYEILLIKCLRKLQEVVLLICCYAMFFNFKLSLFPSKTLTLFKEYSKINESILLPQIIFCCSFTLTSVLQLEKITNKLVSEL